MAAIRGLWGDLMIDPTLGSAIVKAAGGVIQKVLELARERSPDRDAEKALSKVYDKVAEAVSPNSLRVLIVLQEIGSFSEPEQIVEEAQQLADRQEPNGRPLESDISYRLRYLCLLGLAHKGTSDFALTRLGAAFIDKARRDNYRYSRAFTNLSA